jgi:hypothetical protein
MLVHENFHFQSLFGGVLLENSQIVKNSGLQVQSFSFYFANSVYIRRIIIASAGRRDIERVARQKSSFYILTD